MTDRALIGLFDCASQVVYSQFFPVNLKLMWFSSGGTKSVLHLDDGLDNINCLFRGTKEIMFIDYHKYKEKVRGFSYPKS